MSYTCLLTGVYVEIFSLIAKVVEIWSEKLSEVLVLVVLYLQNILKK